MTFINLYQEMLRKRFNSKDIFIESNFNFEKKELIIKMRFGKKNSAVILSDQESEKAVDNAVEVISPLLEKMQKSIEKDIIVNYLKVSEPTYCGKPISQLTHKDRLKWEENERFTLNMGKDYNAKTTT